MVARVTGQVSLVHCALDVIPGGVEDKVDDIALIRMAFRRGGGRRKRSGSRGWMGDGTGVWVSRAGGLVVFDGYGRIGQEINECQMSVPRSKI